MAKLSARNRTELIRLEKVNESPESDNITWERTTVALMSDGHMLRKRDVIFKLQSWETKTKVHSYGWKDKGRIRAEIHKAGFQAAYEGLGYKVVS